MISILVRARRACSPFLEIETYLLFSKAWPIITIFSVALQYKRQNYDTAWFSMLDHKKPARWQAMETWLGPRVSAAGAGNGENSRIQRLTTHRIKIPSPSSFPEQARSEGSAICSFAERLPGQKLLQVCIQSVDDSWIRSWCGLAQGLIFRFSSFNKTSILSVSCRQRIKDG